MGFMLSKVFNSLFGNKEVRILILGLDNAGKTTILYRLQADEPIETIPTIGFNVETLQYKNIKFQVWDLGGQSSFRVIWDKYYSEAHGLIYVVDSSDEARLQEAVSTFAGLIKHTDLSNIPVLIMANKQDLDGACSIEKIEEIFDVKMILRKRPCYVQLCSAYTREGIEDGMNYLMEKVKSVER